MTTNEGFDRRLSAWLAGDAAHRVPDHLDEVLVRTVATRQRAWWSSLERWLPMDLTTHRSTFAPPRIGRALILAVLIVALVVGTILVAGTRRQAPHPFGIARNGAVLSWQAGDIYIADSEQGASRPLITGPTNDIAPLVSRDGTKLVFLRLLAEHESQLMEAAIDGSAVRPVLDRSTIDNDWAEWSATGDRLAVVSLVEGRRTLQVIDVASGTSARIDVNGLQVDNDVYWMPPDGGSLVFTARPTPGPDGPVAIFTIHPDGTGLSRLTKIRPEFASFNGLNVSPDGRTIAYWNYEPDGSPDGMGSRTHLLDVATGADQVMKFDQTAEGETDLVFSPDGRHIVIQREAGQYSQMLIATLDGSERSRRVGPVFAVDVNPGYGFSPDGKRMFMAFENQKPIYIDVATGTSTTGPETVEGFAGYQRLAP
jgi:Tol biopolymer transport system component